LLVGKKGNGQTLGQWGHQKSEKEAVKEKKKEEKQKAR